MDPGKQYLWRNTRGEQDALPACARSVEDAPLPPCVEPQNARHKWVISIDNPFRQVWVVLMILCVLYTATVLPFYVCFVQLGIGNEGISDSWRPAGVVEIFVDVFFAIDLILNFFFTYVNPKGAEIDDQRDIACKYLSSYFFPDFLAVVLPEIAYLCFGEVGIIANGVRMARLSRLVRLMRLSGILRIIKVSKYMQDKTGFGTFLETLSECRAVRFLHSAFGLLIVVHILACGWFLCAAIHGESHHKETWVGRRVVNTDGGLLLDEDPLVQWLHAMYFVLTVFTTVGYGDIAAITPAEIVYACFVMMVGGVVQSVIMSTLITIMTSLDDDTADFFRKKRLIETFASQTELGSEAASELRTWLRHRHNGKESRHYDHTEMQSMLLNGIPRGLLGELPAAIFNGSLISNEFLLLCSRASRSGALPPRLPLLMALELTKQHYNCGVTLYEAFDHCNALYLVISGTFAHIAQPGAEGGLVVVQDKCMMKAQPFLQMSPPPGRCVQTLSDLELHRLRQHGDRTRTLNQYPFQLFSYGSYFGDTEIFSGFPRKHSARCESPAGTVLVLGKKQLLGLMDEFPYFSVLWRAKARQRERQACNQLRGLTVGRSYMELAATRIQGLVSDKLNFRKTLVMQGADDESASTRASTQVVQVGTMLASTLRKPLLQASPTVTVAMLRSELEAHTQQVQKSIMDAVRTILQDRCLTCESTRE